MTKKLQIYRCNVCGNIVIVLHPGVGELVCCGQPMELLEEKTSDVGMEKHVPVVEKTSKGILVKVGQIPHPMEENHYIEWVELDVDNRTYRKFLHPGDRPEALFNISGNISSVRIYCNVHGLWKKE